MLRSPKTAHRKIHPPPPVAAGFSRAVCFCSCSCSCRCRCSCHCRHAAILSAAKDLTNANGSQPKNSASQNPPTPPVAAGFSRAICFCSCRCRHAVILSAAKDLTNANASRPKTAHRKIRPQPPVAAGFSRAICFCSCSSPTEIPGRKFLAACPAKNLSPPGVTPAKTLAGGSGSHQAPHFVTPQSRVCFPRRRAHRRSEARAKVPAAAIQPAAAKRYAKMTNRERIPQFAHSNTDAVPPPSPPRRSNRLPRFSFSSTARPRPSRTCFPQIVE